MAVRLLRSLTFRLALIYLCLFTISIAILLALTWWVSVLQPLAQVREAVRAEALALAELHDPAAAERLAARLAMRAETPADRKAFHVLEAASGETIASNLPRWPDSRDGSWQRFELEEFEWQGGQEREVLAYDIRLPEGSRLLVGRDTEDLDDREELLANALGWGAGATVLLGLVGGLLMSLAVGRRIEAVVGTARQVMAGDLSGRVKVRGAGDDFDRLGETLNEMLARIEALVQSVSRVSDSIAHELRTPLTRLRADLEDLAGALGNADPEQRRVAEDALDEAVRLQTTFDALLRIARIETGRYQTSRARVDIAALLKDAVELYAPVAEERGQAIGLETDPDLHVEADPNLLFQAVSNLLDNAIKYGPPGSTIEVAARSRGGFPEISVRDFGSGIPEESRPHVVERFYRAPDAERTDGLGLGLSLVAAVAQLHDAHLDLEDAAPGLRTKLRFPRLSDR